MLHNFIIIGPDGVRYRVQKIDEPVKPAPVEARAGTAAGTESENLRHIIRSLRKIKKWSQTELGIEAGGITQATISRIESGETELPHDGTIEQLLNVLRK